MWVVSDYEHLSLILSDVEFKFHFIYILFNVKFQLVINLELLDNDLEQL